MAARESLDRALDMSLAELFGALGQATLGHLILALGISIMAFWALVLSAWLSKKYQQAVQNEEQRREIVRRMAGKKIDSGETRPYEKRPSSGL